MEKQKKNYNNFSLLIFFLTIILGVGSAVILFNFLYVATYVSMNYILFYVITFISGFIVSVSLYYIGKLIFGKLAGFKLINFSFWLTNIIKGRKTKVLRGNLQGLGCKVNMLPNKENPNYKLYLLGGCIFTAPFFIGALILLILLPATLEIKYYIFFIFAFIPFIDFVNLIPLRLDSDNEGFTLRLIKNEGSPDKFYKILRQLEALTRDIDKLEYYEVDEVVSPFDIELIYYNYYYLIDREQYLKAFRMCETLIENVDQITDQDKVYLGYVGKIYELCRQERFEESDHFFFDLKNDIKGVIKSRRKYESIKTSLYISSEVECNYDDYLGLYYKKDKISKNYPYLERVDKEAKIIEDTISAIQKRHPDWYVN